MNLTEMTQANYLFKLGKNQCSTGDFPPAIRNLKQASALFLKEKSYHSYLKCQHILIIMYTEMEDFQAVERVRGDLAKVIWSHKYLGADYSRFHYSLGFCFLRQKEYVKAQAQFEQALNQNLKLQRRAGEWKDQKNLLMSKVSACYVSYGFVCLYTSNNQIPEAVQELKNLESLIKQLKDFRAQLKPAKGEFTALYEDSAEEQNSLDFIYNFSKANILRLEQKYESAEQLYWLCYEQAQRNVRRKYMSLHLFYHLSKNYIGKKNYEQAALFLDLAKKSVNPDIFKDMNAKINQTYEELKTAMTDNYDIVVNFDNKMIVEKQKGYIEIRNQFVLLDMLKLFVSHQGAVYSKEMLVEKVWKQKYDPRVHDNKIYVTVKRLRELVEPDHKKPKYIFRTKQGYYISKNVRILLK